MTAAQEIDLRAVLRALSEAGIALWREGSGLRLTPGASVTAALRAHVLACKPALLRYLADEPRRPVAVRLAALGGETVWYAGDTAPIPEFYEGRVVYRTGELRLLRAPSPESLRRLHEDKALLLSFWPGYDWLTHSRIGELRRRAGVPDSERRRIARVLEHMTSAGIMERAEPDGRLFLTECLRLIPPVERCG